mgnify:CR=1 FL=1
MRRFLIFVLIIFAGTTCKRYKAKTLRDVLSSKCFWDRTEEDRVIGGLNSCYQFLPDGQCFFYMYNFYNRRKSDSVYRYFDDDVIVPNRWSVEGDTILIARNYRLKILNFDESSVSYIGYKNDTIVLRKNCKTFREGR